MEKQIEQLLETVNSGTIFLQGELPKVAQEIIRFGVWAHAFGCLVAICLGIAWIYAAKYIRAKIADDEERNIFTGFACVFSIVPIFAFFGNLYGLIKVVIAPRLYLLEQLGKLLSK